MKALLDTNILVDYLHGIAEARDEIARYHLPSVSIITWIEIMVGAASTEEIEKLRSFLRRFEQVPLSAEVAERTIEIRRSTHLRLPDAVIWASAQVTGALLVTRNTRDFPGDDPGVRVPYKIDAAHSPGPQS